MSAKTDSKKLIEERFMKDKDLETFRLTLKYLKEINEGKYEKDFVNAICQYGHYNDSFDLYDAYHLMVINEHIREGRIYYKKVHVGYSPSPDSQIEQNNQKLLNLPNPYKAQFIPSSGRGAEDDGYFEAQSNRIMLLKKYGELEVEEEVSFRGVRLEVGSTESHTTFRHIFVDGGVARWPYYSKDIYLFYNPRPPSILYFEGKDIALEDNKTDGATGEVLTVRLKYTGQSDTESLIDILLSFAAPLNHH